MATAEEAETLQLVNRRGQIKSKFTRFNKYLDETPHPDLMNIKLRLQLIKELNVTFDLVQDRLEELNASDPQHAVERQNFENMYFQTLARGEHLLADSPEIKPEVKDVLPSKRLILPKIEIPKFSGLLEDWVPFWDTFDSLIHKNTSLSTVEKFHFLKNALLGQAKDVINSLELSIVNYDVAINLLFLRYKNTRAIVQRHVQLLFDESQKMVKESAVALKTLLDSTQKHVRALQALSINVEHWDPLLIHMVVSKFDRITLRAWELENVSDKLPTFQQLCEFIQHRCDMLESLHANAQLDKQSSYVKSTVKTNKSFVLSTYNTNCTL